MFIFDAKKNFRSEMFSFDLLYAQTLFILFRKLIKI